MKKLTAVILFVVLAFAASVPAVARTNSSQRAAQHNAKRALKMQKKQHKKGMKAQQKATKEWRKHHHSAY